MPDPLTNQNKASDAAPAHGALAVTPSDSTVLDPHSRALWVGTAGDLNVIMLDGTTGFFKNATGWMMLEVTKVLATSTTASNITAVY